MRPEIEIILLALRDELTVDQETRLARLLAGDIDWHFLSIAAIGHKVCPQLDSLFQKHHVDQKLTGLISQESSEIQRKAMMLTARLFKLQTALLEAGIRFVFVKGALISDLLYGTVKKRSFSDIDVFVSQHDVPHVARILEKEGFFPSPMWCKCTHANEFFVSPSFLKLAYEKEFVSKNNSFAVDLHWGSGTWFATSEQMLRQSEEQQIAGHSIRTLKPDLHFVYLCAHAAKHDWDTLVWISDIARALNSEHKFNWRKIARLSKKLGLFQTVQTSVLLAQNLLDAKIPAALLPVNQGIERAVRDIIRRYDKAVPPVVSLSKIPQWRRIWHTYDSKTQVAKQIAIDLFKPTFSDWVRFKLPENLFWLYSITRPASKVYFTGRNALVSIASNNGRPSLVSVERDAAQEQMMWQRLLAGEKLTDPKQLSSEYRRVLLSQLHSHAMGEYAGGKVYESWIDRAPDAVSKARLECLAKDELKHAKMIMVLLEPFGYQMHELEDEFNKSSLTSHFGKPVESWSELIVFNLLVDGAADHYLHDFADSSWAPWCEVMQQIEEDEVNHLENSETWIEEASRDPAKKELVQVALNRWFPCIDSVFSNAKLKQYQEACVFRIRLRRSDEVRKLWHDELEAKLKKYGYEMP